MMTKEKSIDGISRKARAEYARGCVLTRSFLSNVSQRGGALAADGGALASFIRKTLSKAAPGKSRAILFGSRARGDARPDSDWDARRGTPFYKNVMRDGIPLWTGDYDDAYDISGEDVLPFVEPTGQFIETVVKLAQQICVDK